MRRIIIVFVSIALIFGGTVVYGNYLKKKAEDSGVKNFGGVGRDDSDDGNTPAVIPPSQDGAGSSVSVVGVCVPLKDPAGKDGSDKDAKPFEVRMEAAAEGKSGVVIPLTGEDGLLLYNSDRAAAASRLPSNPSLPDMTKLGEAVAAAKADGLRTTAIIESGVNVLSSETEYSAAIAADSRIAADAAQAGFDEIVICSLVSSPEEITGETSTVILRYLNQMTAAAGNTKVGLSLPYEIYDTVTLSPRIELFISRPIFLAMELPSEKSTVDYLNYICENLAGTLSLYNMRMIMSPADGETAGLLAKKLEDVEHKNYQFAVVVEEEEKVGADDDKTDKTDKTPVTETKE